MAGKGKRGRPADERRRRLAAELRTRGLSLAEVGRELGVSRQAVAILLRGAGAGDPGHVCCVSCAAAVARPALRPRSGLPVLCPACVDKHPDATLGQRLLSRRLAAGLSRYALGRRARVDPSLIGRFERGLERPAAATLTRLARVLGDGLG
jgi:transcriptional regulator with XRE-family HTH domain